MEDDELKKWVLPKWKTKGMDEYNRINDSNDYDANDTLTWDEVKALLNTAKDGCKMTVIELTELEMNFIRRMLDRQIEVFEKRLKLLVDESEKKVPYQSLVSICNQIKVKLESSESTNKIK
jgi:hypothetical protein